MIDAKNDNIYCGLYNFSNNICNELVKFAENINISISKIKEIFEKDHFENIVFVGDASVIYKDLLISIFSSAIFASAENNVQKGASIALAGFSKYSQNNYGNSSTLSPIYLKKSQAERTLEEKIEISNMTLEDIETISPIFNTEFDEFWNINNLKNDFSSSNSLYFVAKLYDEVVGFAGFLKICEEANIMNIVTKVSKRRLGIGSKLLEALILSAKEQNCTSITLEVNEHNKPAINLYEKYNFKRIGLRKKYYNNTDNAILMRLAR